MLFQVQPGWLESDFLELSALYHASDVLDQRPLGNVYRAGDAGGGFQRVTRIGKEVRFRWRDQDHAVRTGVACQIAYVGGGTDQQRVGLSAGGFGEVAGQRRLDAPAPLFEFGQALILTANE